MNVLTIFAHPGSKSFCHAVLERFDAGLRDAGHTNEIVDLYAIGFDPILRPRDNPCSLTETIPDDMLDRMRLRESLLDGARGPLRRYTLKRIIGDVVLEVQHMIAAARASDIAHKQPKMLPAQRRIAPEHRLRPGRSRPSRSETVSDTSEGIPR